MSHVCWPSLCSDGSPAEPSPSSPVLGPADRDPLWLLLGLLHEGEELHAGVMKVLIHQDTVKKVPVFDLHQPGRLLQVQEVLLLQVEKMEVTNMDQLAHITN